MREIIRMTLSLLSIACGEGLKKAQGNGPGFHVVNDVFFPCNLRIQILTRTAQTA